MEIANRLNDFVNCYVQPGLMYMSTMVMYMYSCCHQRNVFSSLFAYHGKSYHPFMYHAKIFQGRWKYFNSVDS